MGTCTCVSVGAASCCVRRPIACDVHVHVRVRVHVHVHAHGHEGAIRNGLDADADVDMAWTWTWSTIMPMIRDVCRHAAFAHVELLDDDDEQRETA